MCFFSALTLLVGSFDPYKPVPDMTYNVFGGTLNLTQSSSSQYSDSIQLRTKMQYRLQLQYLVRGITVTPNMLKGVGNYESPCTDLLTSVNSRNLAMLQVEQAVYL